MRKSISWVLGLLSALMACRVLAPRALAAPAGSGEVYKSSYRIVDVHTHGAWPTPSALQAQFAVMDATGVDAITLLLFDPAGFPFNGGWSEPNLRAWLELRRQFPERLNVFGTVDFGRTANEPAFFQAIVSELSAAAKLGMQGIKIWKNLGMHHRDASGALLTIDDPRLDPFWAQCGELGLPVLIHAADPREYWYPNTYNTFQYKQGNTARYYEHPAVPGWEDLIRQRNHLLQKHPKTNFIAAHFASLTSDLDQLAELLDKFPNLSVECSARLRFFYRYHPEAIRDFFIRYQDRILFGSDIFLIADDKTLQNETTLKAWRQRQTRAYSDYLEYFETDHMVMVPGGYQPQWLRLKGIHLPPTVLEKFYHGNAERLIPGSARALAAGQSEGAPAGSIAPVAPTGVLVK